jgi:hypothetical protein
MKGVLPWLVRCACRVHKIDLCPFAVYYLRYAVRSFFTLSRISLPDGKRAGQKVQRKIAAAVQNVKPLYFLSRSFEISETNCQQSFF